jgi:DNA-binding transcriptional LysR family regulator
MALLSCARRRPNRTRRQGACLVRVLPDWSGGFVHDVYLVTGSNQLPQRVRLFVDHIQAHFAAAGV